MKKAAFLFPHIPRLFSAPIRSSLLAWSKLLIVWGVVGLLIAANRFWPTPHEKRLPNPSSPVLGATVQPTVTQTQLDYWKRMTEEKPDYRDAFIKAAAIALDLGKMSEARTFIDKALLLDPNSPTALAISKLLEKSE